MERLLILLLLLPVSTCEANVPRLTIRALKGSCVVIPCAFANPEPRKPPGELRIDWYSGQGSSPSTIYSGQRPETQIPEYRGRTAFVGDLATDNCSLQINNVRTQDGAVYFPWIKPVTRDYEQYTVQVSDQPEEPSLSDPGEMTEGTPVRISCSTVHTCPPHPPTLNWSGNIRNASIHHEDLGGGTWKTVSEISYTPVSVDHNASLQCTALYADSISSKKPIALRIRYPPKNTRAVVKGDGVLREGDNVTLVCSADGNPPISLYQWSDGQPEKALAGDGQEITLESIGWDSGPYYCTAKNQVGDGKSAPLKPNITYAPKGTQVVGPEKSPHHGDHITLECRTESSNPAVHNYSWYKDGNLLGNQTERTLNIENAEPDNTGQYHCVAQNAAGRSRSANVTVAVMASQALPTNRSFAVLGATTAFLLLLLLALFFFLWSSRKKKKEAAVQRPPTSSIPAVQPNAPKEVVYVTIDHSKHRGPQRRSVPIDDYVTYAAVKSYSENEAAPVSDPTYAEVKKPSTTPKSKQKEDEVIYETDLKFVHRTSNGQESHNDDNVEYATVKR